MRRRLLNLLTVLSLLLCVAVCVLWVRSYFVSDYGTKDWGAKRADGLIVTEWMALTGKGRVRAERNTYLWPTGASLEMPSSIAATWETRPPRNVVDWFSGAITDWCGFGLFSSQEANVVFPSHSKWIVLFPLWLPALLFAMLPLARIGSRIRRARRRRCGRCPSCGYDLRATPGRCTECGSVASVTTNG